ncbi:MAG: glycerol-3-phosphate dehydrogenase/oxidase [Verrucomicrobiales bacterium]|nr:glycerol-3-phosphate dehydrogenase/oxidase [Verrucomicrobiales bacterium]
MNRSAMLDQLADSSTEWDVIVIGGGATGLGIAVDSATRGLKTLLLEQADFSEGTSSRSTKLIHGGVRYLRGGEVGLVRESLRERGRLLHNAPNLVRKLSFVVPAYRWYERIFYGTGLVLYDFLAGKLGIESTGHLAKSKTLEKIPNLNPEGLRGGTLYWDGQFDDARLSVALARTAAANGAAILNHVRVTGLQKNGAGKVNGIEAKDLQSGKSYSATGKIVINATGVFTDSVRKMDEPKAENVIAPSQGIHIVLDAEFLGGETAIMIPNTDDGRVLFAIPWYGKLVLGTTDTADVPVELNPRPLEEEIDYLIEHAGRYLVKAPKREDVRATFAGLRPLVRPPAPKTEDGETEKKETSKISRSHSLFVSKSGLLTIAGGKWTTYRQMAEDAVDKAIKLAKLNPEQSCSTKDLTLLDREESEIKELMESDPSLLEKLASGLPWRMADVVYAVRNEMAQTLVDVLARRTRVLFLDETAARKCAHPVAQLMARELGKNETWIAEQLKLMREVEGL